MENLSSARAAARAGATPHSARRTYQFVLQGLGRAIVSGQYPVSSLLPTKDELMRVYGVSASSIREALQTLTAKGLLMARSKVGTWVRDETHWDMFDADVLAWKLEQGPDRKFLGQLFEIRAALEPLAASLAAIRRSNQQAISLEVLAGQMSGNHDRQSFTRVDVAFHKGVLEASDNPFLLSIGAVIETALAASFMLSAPTDDLSLIATAQKQHRAIARAISRRSPQAAATAMRNVVDQGWIVYSGTAPTNLGSRIYLTDFLETDTQAPG